MNTATCMEIDKSPKLATVQSVIRTIPLQVYSQDTEKKIASGLSGINVLSSPQEAHLQSKDSRTRDVILYNKAPTPIILTNSPVDHRRGPYVFLLDDVSRSTLIAKPSPNGRAGNLDLIIKHDDRLMEETNRRVNDDNDDYSDGGSEGSLDDVRQHHGIIKSTKSDDHEYLTLYEAHLSRLEEAGNPNPGWLVSV